MLYNNDIAGVESGNADWLTGFQPGQGEKFSSPANLHKSQENITLKRKEVGMSPSSALLISETPHIVIPSFAAEIGLYECLLLQQLHWLIENNDCKYHDGHFWWKHTNEQWVGRLPYFQNEKRVLKTVKSLRSQNLLITETLSWKIDRVRGDRTLWYRVNYVEVERLEKELRYRKDKKKLEAAMAKNEPTTLGSSGNSQLGCMGDSQLGSMTHTQNGRMINKTYIKDLSSSKKPAEAGFDCPLILIWILSELRNAGYDVDGLNESFIKASFEEYTEGAEKPAKSRALTWIETALKQRQSIERRSMKNGQARDAVNDATANQLQAQATSRNQKALSIAPKTTEQKLTDRSWADGLVLDFDE